MGENEIKKAHKRVAWDVDSQYVTYINGPTGSSNIYSEAKVAISRMLVISTAVGERIEELGGSLGDTIEELGDSVVDEIEEWGDSMIDGIKESLQKKRESFGLNFGLSKDVKNLIDHIRE